MSREASATRDRSSTSTPPTPFPRLLPSSLALFLSQPFAPPAILMQGGTLPQPRQTLPEAYSRVASEPRVTVPLRTSRGFKRCSKTAAPSKLFSCRTLLHLPTTSSWKHSSTRTANQLSSPTPLAIRPQSESSMPLCL